MSEELKKTGDLLDGLAANPPEPLIVTAAGSPAADAALLVDSKGVTFNPAIHQVDGEGSPIIGSVKQFLLKKEAKKSALKRAADKFSEFWNGEKEPKKEIPEIQDIPLSDHEIDQIQAKNRESEFSEQPEQARKPSLLSSSAENSADLFFVGGSMLVGIEFLNQRQRFHGQAAEVIAEYERRTGKQMDLPPGVALALGLGRIGYEIIQREPACKAKFETGVRVVRENAGRYIRSKIPVLNKFQKQEQPVGGADAAA
jgi:hypothetical protein